MCIKKVNSISFDVDFNQIPAVQQGNFIKLSEYLPRLRMITCGTSKLKGNDHEKLLA